ncbi:MAG: hypothetical protein JNL80_09830 [Phycisphaerae bacterium]|jgi:hypothetical protein|nr:hypothetical protein [Phycisphaerae bacterium]
MFFKQFVVAAVAAITSPCVFADFVAVDLSAKINADIRSYTGGISYPLGGQTLSFGSVPFTLGLLNGSTTTLGAVQLPGNGQPTVHSFPVNIAGATRLYTLINSTWGVYGVTNGKIEVFGTNGAYASFSLVQGFNIRDHYQGNFQNIINDSTVVSTGYASGARLDRQVLELPAAFDGQVVTELRFQGTGLNPSGAAFLAGATFETVDSCPADFDHNGAVGASDLAILLGAWGTANADLDNDGTTTASDLAFVLGAWGPCP